MIRMFFKPVYYFNGEEVFFTGWTLDDWIEFVNSPDEPLEQIEAKQNDTITSTHPSV